MLQVSSPRIPRATYRIQFTRDFTFRQAAAIADYLESLGISECYASPVLMARPGSKHGYDICDHSRLNPELGTPEDFDGLTRNLRERGLGLLVDIVPNHMGIGDPCNIWWMDVLENGPSSTYARYFDIDWHPVKPELENKVLLPILEDQYGNVLESGKIRLVYESGAFFLYYYDRPLPVAPGTYRLVLNDTLERLQRALPSENEQRMELESIVTALNHLPSRTETDPAKISVRNREREIVKRRLDDLYHASAEFHHGLDETLVQFNGRPGDPRSFDALDGLINAQAYRPAFWRVAAEEINYRRFFDINDMAAIHAELPEVFEATHRLILQLIAEGKITGVRVDHPDGLWNPSDYFGQLQREVLIHSAHVQGTHETLEREAQAWLNRTLQEQIRPDGDQAPAAAFPLYVVAEKILSESEPLPRNWAVYGTTGYDFCNAVNGLFVNPDNEKAFNKIYNHLPDSPGEYAEIVYDAKRSIMHLSLSSEINSLAHELERVAEKNRHYRDLSLNSLRLAIREMIAALGIYRTYVDVERRIVSERDRTSVEAAVNRARRRNPGMPASLFHFVRDTLLLRNYDDFTERDRIQVAYFIMRFQQMTGPIMAKGVEDTAFYIYNRLVSLNEVGGNPSIFGSRPAVLHRRNAEHAREWPHTLLSTSTHDTKRSEDVRARINVLSELPDEWRRALARWRRLNQGKKDLVDDRPAPDANDEYLLYQTLIGAWPLDPDDEEWNTFRERIKAYMHKATKEAKRHTSWVSPNAEYDEALDRFVERLLARKKKDPFHASIAALAGRVAFFGRLNSLAQVLLKLTSPGVPDLYQGTELFDYSLVDPDNRRPVDYALRRKLLDELVERQARGEAALLELVAELIHDLKGRSKLYVISRILNWRREHPVLFAAGNYKPLEARGEKANHVFAFARQRGEEALVVVAPRLVVGLLGGKQEPPLAGAVWGETRIAVPPELGERFRNLLTGEQLELARDDGVLGLRLAQVLANFPVAALERA